MKIQNVSLQIAFIIYYYYYYFRKLTDNKRENESKQGKRKKGKKETNVEAKPLTESVPDASATTSEAVAKSTEQVSEPSEKPGQCEVIFAIA